MSLVLNRARAATTTTGTGIVTLGAGIIPFQSWSAAGAVDGKTYPYVIEDGSAWEVGYGVYTAAGTSLTRNLSSSSTGALLNLSGSAVVNCTERAEDLNEEGATVTFSESTSSTSFTDLATVGPTVTLVTGTSAIIHIAVISDRSGGSGFNSYAAVAVSGATTIAATDANGSTNSSAGAGFATLLAKSFKLTGLNPGTNTFKLQYRCNGGGPWVFVDRNLVVKSSI